MCGEALFIDARATPGELSDNLVVRAGVPTSRSAKPAWRISV